MSILLAQTAEEVQSVLDDSFVTPDVTTVTTSATSPWSTWTALFSGVYLVADLILYVYSALVLMYIAKKTNTANGWLAFIPIANLILMLQIAKMSLWYLLLFLVPIANVILIFVIWYKIFIACGRPGWWVILLLIPVVNLIIMGITAFGNSSPQAPAAPQAPQTPQAPAAPSAPAQQ